MIDDQRLVRYGLRALLDQTQAMLVIGEARNGRNAISLNEQLALDVVIMDIALPGLGGLAATESIKRDPRSPQVLVLATNDCLERLERAMRVGALAPNHSTLAKYIRSSNRQSPSPGSWIARFQSRIGTLGDKCPSRDAAALGQDRSGAGNRWPSPFQRRLAGEVRLHDPGKDVIGMHDIAVQVASAPQAMCDVGTKARVLRGAILERLLRQFDGGVDDYLTKPFGVGELLARLRVLLRPAATVDEKPEALFTSGDLKVDLVKRQAWVGAEQVHLTPIEYKLLTTLIKYAGKVVTHGQLLKEVWGPAYAGESQYLRVYMTQLRHKLEADPARPRYLTTEIGVGYRLKVDES